MKAQGQNIQPLGIRQDEMTARIERLYNVLPTLSDQAIIAIYFRYWDCKTISEIAGILRCSWTEANAIINEALVKLRMKILKAEENETLLEAV